MLSSVPATLPVALQIPAVLTPLGFRVACAHLVAHDRLDEADVMSLAGVVRFPYSEETLVMRALVAEVRQEWDIASLALHTLLRLQGADAPAETWRHWVRVLRCLDDTEGAREALREALAHHPDHPLLLEEAPAVGLSVASVSRRRVA